MVSNRVIEADVERALLRAVTEAGGLTWKIPADAVESGFPDRLILTPRGELRLVELKSPTGRLRPVQRLWHEKAARLGFTVDIVRTMEEARAWAAENC